MEKTYCESCGAVGESCCASAQERMKTASTLARIVTRQSDRLAMLTLELYEARTVIKELRAKIQTWVETPV